MSTAAEGTPVHLVEPVRQRLVDVAAEVLGRMPAEQVPPALRAIARFTPSKRRRLGGAAIAAALDTDDAFRAAVGTALAEGAPTLAEGVRAGDQLPATDPLDAAATAYLLRPDGWEQTLAEATARWEQVNSPVQAAADQLAELRAELAATRGQLRQAQSEADRLRAELAARPAAEPETDEVARLTRELRNRVRELRAAERDRDEARTALSGAEATRAEGERARNAARDLELEAMRARVAELERDGARRSARVERDLDDARLRMLLDTLTDAAAGVRRELALPASTMRPADAVTADTTGAGSTAGADDAAGLDRLLALPQAHLIVDGYNVTKTGYGELPLADQRARLLAGLAALRSRVDVEVTVAFDGAARPAVQPRAPRGVRVLFSRGEIADDLIRRLVAAEPAGRPLVVVTSDQAIVTDVRAAGAHAVPSRVLLALLG